LPFFHIFHIFSQFSSVFSKYFHYSTSIFPKIISLFSSIFSLSFHNFLLYFPNLFTIRLIFIPYFPMFSSYQKQVLTAMISPLGTNCYNITIILLTFFIIIINVIKFLLVIFLS
jgi:hypothetical protein